MGNGPPPNGSKLAGLPGAVLGLVANLKSWSQLAILIVFGAALLFGFLIYLARERIVAALGAFLEGPPAITLAAPDVAATVATQLAARLKPDVGVVVWEVDLGRNRRTIVAFAPGDEQPPEDIRDLLTVGATGPLFSRELTNQLLIDVVNGEEVCGAPAAYVGSAPPLPFVCLAGIPTGPGLLVGLVGIGFLTAPTAARLEYIRVAVGVAAEKLTAYR